MVETMVHNYTVKINSEVENNKISQNYYKT